MTLLSPGSQAWEPSWGAIRRRAVRSLGESGRSFGLGGSTSGTFWTRPDRLEAYFTPRRSLVRSQYRPPSSAASRDLVTGRFFVAASSDSVRAAIQVLHARRVC